MYEKLLSNNEDKLNNIIIKKEIFKKSFINLIELKFELIYKFLININKFFKSLKNEGLYLTLKKNNNHLRLTNPTPKHIQIATPIYESKKQIYCKQNNIKL